MFVYIIQPFLDAPKAFKSKKDVEEYIAKNYNYIDDIRDKSGKLVKYVKVKIKDLK